jgi:signal-transduction protein with cAMP-binding, CBS, and nucleotidyltransferase domain
MAKLVKDFMIPSKELTLIPITATLKEAMSLMKKSEMKFVVVDKRTDDDAYGILTQKNILKSVIIEKGDIDLINVYDVATKPALSVSRFLNIKHAGKMILNHHIKQILVIDDNILQGVIDIESITGEIFEQVED